MELYETIKCLHSKGDNGMKNELIDWEKMSINHRTKKRLIPKIYRELNSNPNNDFKMSEGFEQEFLTTAL